MGNLTGSAGEVQLTTKKQLSYSEIEQIGKAFVASRMFGDDVDRISVAITKIMAGQELGLAPFASMRAVHVIEGNATLSANTMAGMVKSSGRYDYEVKQKDLEACNIDFFELRGNKRVKVGSEEFTIEEARMAGMFDPECSEAPLKHNLRNITMYKKGGGSWEKKNACNCKANWKNYPKAMLFARCISNGVRTYCPDVFSGMLVYTPDELDSKVSKDGSYIDMDPETGEILSMPTKEQKTKQAVEPEAQSTENEMPEDFLKQEEPVSDDDIDDLAETIAIDDSSDQIVVNDEMIATTKEMFSSLPLKGADRARFLKETLNVLSINNVKTEDQWRTLHDKCSEILAGAQ